jgi:hypothetical protein
MGVGRLLRHPSVLSGNWNFRRDEEENLEGAGYLGRGKLISRFFDTLEYREGNPERGFFLKCLRGGRTSYGVPKPGSPGRGNR